MEEAVHGISGGLSGLVALSIWYPLDNLRMREQADILNEVKIVEEEIILKEKEIHPPSQYSIGLIYTRLKNYFSNKLRSLEFAKSLIKKEGAIALYKGMPSAMVGIVVAYGVYFFSYKMFKNILIKNNFNKGVIIDSLITSFLAACASSIISNPIWVVNSRMSKSKDKTNFEMIKQILREEGLGGFFKGILPALILTINPVIQFVIYEFLRLKLMDRNGQVSAFNIVLNSIISKLVTTLVTYPMVTVKTLFQANEDRSNEEIIDVIKNLLKNEGFGGLYRGISAKIVQTLMNNVILMFTYERVQNIVKLVLLYLLFKVKKTN